MPVVKPVASLGSHPIKPSIMPLRGGPRPVSRRALARCPEILCGDGSRKSPGPELSKTNAWRQHWWPVAPLRDVPQDRPAAFKVLEQDMVVWRDADGAHAFVDACPHRLAPLSQGRINERGLLECGYHGWAFDGAGHCKTIPQATPKEQVALSKPRSCATPFPVLEDQGLLWVWPEADGAALAATQRPHKIPAASQNPAFPVTTFQRLIDLDYAEVMENVLDPSHVPFAHHGVLVYARDRPVPLDYATEQTTTDGGFLMRATSTSLQFAAPFGSFYSYPMGWFDVLVVPVEPGVSRILIVATLGIPIGLPQWFTHMGLNAVLDGDAEILAAIARRLDPNKAYAKQTYCATRADSPPLLFRAWLEKNGGPFDGASGTRIDRPELLDRLHQHTDLCGSCKPTHARLKNAERALGTSTPVLQAIAIAAAVTPGHARAAMICAAASIVGAAMRLGAQSLRQRFESRGPYIRK